MLEVSGKRAGALFAGEAGGHRWQRVPPNERRGRRHTSTITVAVLPVPDGAEASISDVDIECHEVEWKPTKGSGSGGQARNKVSSAVQMRHKPTGIAVRVEAERSQWLNRQAALRLIAARVAAEARSSSSAERARERKGQVGTGQRGDKRRTIRTQDDTVVDHVSGWRTSYSAYAKGRWPA